MFLSVCGSVCVRPRTPLVGFVWALLESAVLSSGLEPAARLWETGASEDPGEIRGVAGLIPADYMFPNTEPLSSCFYMKFSP